MSLQVWVPMDVIDDLNRHAQERIFHGRLMKSGKPTVYYGNYGDGAQFQRSTDVAH